MPQKKRRYLKINLITIFFIAISCITATFAWFAYSGLSDLSTQIDISTWTIELKKNGEKISNSVLITLPEIYPGMETHVETIDIENLGDSDALVKYEIISARILDLENDYYIVGNSEDHLYVEDRLSHYYPFHINIKLDDNFVLSQGGKTKLKISVSWPLDAGDNDKDSLWGTKAYNFYEKEKAKYVQNNDYVIKNPIEVRLKIAAEQYISAEYDSDIKYNFGRHILFDVVNNRRCTTLSSTCLNTFVIDQNNKISDTSVTLLPQFESVTTSDFNSYTNNYNALTNNWTVNNRKLEVSDLLNIISTDIIASFYKTDSISNIIIGKLNYQNRMAEEIASAKANNGYFTYENASFSYLVSNTCIWTNTEYSSSLAFSLTKIDNTRSKIYGTSKSTNCAIVPVITALKSNL